MSTVNGVERSACVASVLITAADGAIFALGRWANGLYAEEPLWIVAQYSLPWALAAVVVTIGLVWLWLLRAAVVRKVSLRRLIAGGLAAFALSFAVCLEAGMGIYYQQVTGEFHVTAVTVGSSGRTSASAYRVDVDTAAIELQGPSVVLVRRDGNGRDGYVDARRALFADAALERAGLRIVRHSVDQRVDGDGVPRLEPRLRRAWLW